MAVTLNPTDPADNGLQTWLHQQGATNPSVVDKEQVGPNEWLYTVRADSWAAPYQFNDADGARRCQIKILDNGSVGVTPIGYDLA